MKQPKTETKQVHIDSALPIFAAAGVFLLGSLIFPVYNLWGILVSGGLAAATFAALKLKVFKGREASVTHEYYTGDKQLDAQIKYGFETIERFRLIAQKEGDGETAASLTRIADAAEGIVDDVITDPQDRGDASTFFSYYLPTIDKLMYYYEQFSKNAHGENAAYSKARVESCLGMVAGAYEKFLDKLYRNDAAEIKTSIEVLKIMLRSEGLASKEDTKTQIKKPDMSAYSASEMDADIENISKSLQSEADMELKQVAAGSAH